MSSFIEICTYEVKPEKINEFEILLEDISVHHKSFGSKINACSPFEFSCKLKI